MSLTVRQRKILIGLLTGAGVLVGAVCLRFSSLVQDRLTDLRTPRTAAVTIDPAVPVAVSLSGVSFPPVHRLRLKNGLRVLILEDHRLPRVTMRLIVPAGQVYAPAPAVAELTNAMLNEGTTNHTEEQIADALEQRGATFAGRWNQEDASLQVTGLSEHTNDLLGLLSDMAMHANFPADKLEMKKRLQIADDMAFQGAGYVSNSVAAFLLYGATPYGHLPMTDAEVNRVQTSDLVDFYQTHYCPNQAILAVSGDVDTKSLEKLVESNLGTWPAAADVAPPSFSAVADTPGTPPVSLIDWPKDKQAYITLQCLTVSYGDPDYFPLLVANRILGGVGTSRLGEDLREDRGFTYGASSSFYAPAHWPGIWYASADVPTEQVGTAIEDIRTQMNRLRSEPVDTEELKRTKNGLIGDYERSLETPDYPLSMAAGIEMANLPENLYESRISRVAAVTSTDIQRVAAKYFAPNRVHIVVVGTPELLNSTLSAFGPVQHYSDLGAPKL